MERRGVANRVGQREQGCRNKRAKGPRAGGGRGGSERACRVEKESRMNTTEETGHRLSAKKRNKGCDEDGSDKPGRGSDGDRVNGSGREGGSVAGRRPTGLKSSIARIFAVTSRKSCATLPLRVRLILYIQSQTEENWNDTPYPFSFPPDI